MDEFTAVTRRVGIVLIVVGLADIGLMIYCIAHNQSYSSSLNVFAVVAGIFVWRRSPKAISFVTSAAAFLLAGCGGVLLLFPFLMPLDLWAAYFHQDPVMFTLSSIFGVAALGFMYWTYRQLRLSCVLEAQERAGKDTAVPRKYFVIGASIPVLITGIMYFASQSDTEKEAISRAQAQLGPNYRYHVASMRISNGHVWATVEAYNDTELKSVKVEWE